LAHCNGFGLDNFRDCQGRQKTQQKTILLLVVEATVRQVVGPSGLLIAIIAYWSFAVLVLLWGWEKKKRN